VLAPVDVHRYTCPCGELVLDVRGPSWTAWDMAMTRALEHGETCAAAAGTWSLEVLAPTS
jgi:hypothetical protein